MGGYFLSSDMSRFTLQNIIGKIESAREIQNEINNIYSSLCDTLIAEMDNSIPFFLIHPNEQGNV